MPKSSITCSKQGANINSIGDIMKNALADKFYGAWWGMFLGDSIAMPSHGYSTSKLLNFDYGKIDSLLAPKDPHPESILQGLPQPDLPENCDYLGSNRRRLWRKAGTHPHHGLEAGANTLPMILALHLGASMAEKRKFDLDAWMERYCVVMTSPGGHDDTFIPSIHRRYFENVAASKDPEKNGCPDAHMSDIAIFLPLMFGSYRDPARTQMTLYRALRKFTIGEGASTGAFFLSEILAWVMRGSSIEDAIYKNMTPDRHGSLAFPFRRWIKNREDETAISSTGRLAPIEEAIPLSIYFSLKYSSDLEAALFANANTGGETTGRGAVIGALVGAQCGFEAMPKENLAKLKYSGEIQAVGDIVFSALNHMI